MRPKGVAMTFKLVLGSVLLVSMSAGAEPPVDAFGASGQVILSADRLSPLLSYSRIKQDQGGGDSTTTSTTSMSLLWTGSPQDFYDIPRVGLDYVIAPNITIGGSLFATLPMSSTRSTTQNGTTTSRDGTKLDAVGLAARGGYVMPLSPRVAFWPRGGLSYTRVGTTNTQGGGGPGGGGTTSSTDSQWALSLEPLFVITAAPHLGIVAGPVLDLPLAGTHHAEFTNNGMSVSTDNDESQLHLGLTLGLLGWF
ncbi:MAG: hypothetical protein ACM31C_29040 [Acidobacteriota bacterium]